MIGGSLPTLRGGGGHPGYAGTPLPAGEKKTSAFYFQVIHPDAVGSGLFAKSTQGNPPKRFIFIHKGNGLFPDALVPPTLSEEEKAMEKRKDAFEVELKTGLFYLEGSFLQQNGKKIGSYYAYVEKL